MQLSAARVISAAVKNCSVWNQAVQREIQNKLAQTAGVSNVHFRKKTAESRRYSSGAQPEDVRLSRKPRVGSPPVVPGVDEDNKLVRVEPIEFLESNWLSNKCSIVI